jgi:hypothetical protein
MGSALPDFRYSIAQNLTYKKFTAYLLFDAVKGNSVYNEGKAWSYGDYMVGAGGGINAPNESQAGASVSTALPLGYFFRANSPESSGVGGLYDVLGTNSFTVENASYVKLRELSFGYRIGKIAGQGDWTVSIIGRNLYTWTPYSGYDPEVGINTSQQSGSAALAADDEYGFPNLRTLTLQLSSSF